MSIYSYIIRSQLSIYSYINYNMPANLHPIYIGEWCAIRVKRDKEHISRDYKPNK